MPLPNDQYQQATGGAVAADLVASSTASVGTSKYLARVDHVHPSAAAPVAAGATRAITSADAGKTILLNTAAGSVITLPAATGSGNKYKFVVTTTTTSGAHKILPASVADFMIGRATGATAAGATLQFGGVAATSHSIQMPFAGSQPSGGILGDVYELEDVANGLWEVKGQYQAGTTATTPFSAATT